MFKKNNREYLGDGLVRYPTFDMKSERILKRPMLQFGTENRDYTAYELLDDKNLYDYDWVVRYRELKVLIHPEKDLW